MQNLQLIKEKLELLNSKNKVKNLLYLIPKIWVNSFEISEIESFKLNNPFLDENLTYPQKQKFNSLNNLNNTINVNPYEFYIFIINKLISFNKSFNKDVSKIENISDSSIKNSELRVYNIFTRYFGAFDHNNNGLIDFNQNLNENLNENINSNTNVKKSKGKLIDKNIANRNVITFYDSSENSINYEFTEFNELGTFLKATMLLFYIKTLNINTVYLLPVFEIGVYGKKGSLGSPYAIKNYYNIEKSQSEFILELTPEIEFKAFSEACKILDIKLILEFVFRITSLDNDWALENPDWFYWIKSSVKMREPDDTSESKYGSPIFLKRELKEIKDKIEIGDFKNLTPPHETFRNLFTPIPKKVARVEGKMLGIYDTNKECTIASAFADWPPDDNQPPWADVAYLRLYDNNNFNYVAYNTIRMYDDELATVKNEVKNLWETLSVIIPHYISNYGIDGAMIDMGHALPKKLRNQIIKNARNVKEDFIFWEENFGISQQSKEDGYDACLGYFFLDAHVNYKVKEIIFKTCNGVFEQNFFLTSENHNTLRSAYRCENEFRLYDNIKDEYTNHLYSKLIYTITQFLPQIKFIYNGFELGETLPTNTGLGFNEEHLKEFSNIKLPLFNEEKLPWDYIDVSGNNLNDDISLVNFNTYSKQSIYEYIVTFNSLINSIKSKFSQIMIEYKTFNNYLDFPNSLIYIENIFSDKNQNKFSKLILIGNFSLENVVYEFDISKLFYINDSYSLTNISIIVGNDIKFQTEDSFDELNGNDINNNLKLELRPFEFCVLNVSNNENKS